MKYDENERVIRVEKHGFYTEYIYKTYKTESSTGDIEHAELWQQKKIVEGKQKIGKPQDYDYQLATKKMLKKFKDKYSGHILYDDEVKSVESYLNKLGTEI